MAPGGGTKRRGGILRRREARGARPRRTMSFLCSTCKREVEAPGRFCPFCGAARPAEDAPLEPLAGRKVAGKYVVHHRLGKGGMGLVYKATDVVLDRPVALKVLDRALLSDGS